jgi:hypothetical protein
MFQRTLAAFLPIGRGSGSTLMLAVVGPLRVTLTDTGCCGPAHDSIGATDAAFGLGAVEAP